MDWVDAIHVLTTVDLRSDNFSKKGLNKGQIRDDYLVSLKEKGMYHRGFDI